MVRYQVTRTLDSRFNDVEGYSVRVSAYSSYWCGYELTPCACFTELSPGGAQRSEIAKLLLYIHVATLGSPRGAKPVFATRGNEGL